MASAGSGSKPIGQITFFLFPSVRVIPPDCSFDVPSI